MHLPTDSATLWGACGTAWGTILGLFEGHSVILCGAWFWGLVLWSLLFLLCALIKYRYGQVKFIMVSHKLCTGLK